MCSLVVSRSFPLINGARKLFRSRGASNPLFCNSSSYLSKMSTIAKPKVFVTRSDIPEQAMDLLKSRFELIVWDEPRPVPRDFFLKNVVGVDAIFCLITDKVDNELLDAAGRNLKVVGTMSVGVDHVDLEALKSRDIKLGFTPDVLTDATAETTIIALLAASRRVFEANKEISTGKWANSAWSPLYMCGQGLSGSTVGIFGLGRIGRAVMERLKGFRVNRFLYSGRSKKSDVTDAEFVEFDTLCKESDFIIVTCSLTPKTKEIFDERAFSLMKKNAVFVNSSRGGTVQQDALIKALKENKIYAAGLDVMTPEPLPPDHELVQLENCALLPHIGSATFQSRTAMAMLTAENIIAALNGDPMPQRFC